MQKLGISALLVLAIVVGAPASALRGVEPGATCQGAAKIEAELGSIQRRETPKSVWFDGQHLGHKVLIGYTCEAGVIVAQLISFKFTSEQEAMLSFADVKRSLTSDFGSASNDADPNTISAMQRESSTTQITGLPVQRFATWVIDQRVVSLMLSGRKDSWELIVQGP